MDEVLSYLIGFSIFVVLQSLFINGVYASCKGSMLKDDLSGEVNYQGMIFYMLAPKFFERNKNKEWAMPFFGCIKCMASFWGTVTFLPTAIYFFRFHWEEIFVFIFDVFILVYLNFYFYNKA